MTLAPSRVGWWLMLLGAVLVVLTSARYFTLNPAVYFPHQRAVYEAHSAALLLHLGGMAFALALGPFQFLRSLRARQPGLHRLIGRVYLLGALVGGLAGLEMASRAAYGPVSGIGFALLAVGVLVTGTIAFRRIREGRVQAHREWMTRNFALIFAAVTLRLYLPLLAAWFGEPAGYVVVAWLCWVPNLVVAEWLVRSRVRRTSEPALIRV
jgi:uncharacterized membrane protein